MGRETVAELATSALEEFGRRLVDAVAAGDFELARAFMEEAIRVRAAQGSKTPP